jgi:predicted TIM-barrel fold metal-dependent hydrolase
VDIVDSQVHFGPGGIDELLAGMDALGINAVLADEFWGLDNWGPGYRLANGVLRVTAPTAELAAAQHPNRFSYVLRVERLDPEVESLVRMASDAPGIRAIRTLPSLTAEELAAFKDGAYADVFNTAGSVGLPVFLYIAGQVHLLPPYLEQFPQVHFIIDHCGMPMEQGISFLDAETPDQAKGVNVHSGPDISYFDEVLKIAEYPNAALKWSHAQGMFGVLDYPFNDLMPFLRRALDAFGPERIMWASDMGGNQTGESWAELLFYIRDCPAFTDTEKEWLLGKTVRTLLDWK